MTAGIAILGMFSTWCGLSRLKTVRNSALSLLQQLRIGFTSARKTPRIALSYSAAFVGRTDLLVVVIFLSLWITHAGVEQGMSTEEALVMAAMGLHRE